MASVADRARKRAKEIGGSKFYKMAVGDNCIRVLPTPKGKKSDELFIEIQTHDKVGPNKKWLRCGIDPVTGKGKCWICDKLIPQLRKKGKEERAAALEPRRQMVVMIAEVDPEDGSMVGPKPWLPSMGVQKGLLAKVFDSKKHNYTDLKKGYNLTYKRVGSGQFDTEYFGPDKDDEPSKVPSSVHSKLRPFEEVKDIPTYSESVQKKAYNGDDDSSSSSAEASSSGSVDESVDLDDEDNEKKNKGKKVANKKKSKKEEEASSAEASSAEDSSTASSSAADSSAEDSSADSSAEDSSAESSDSEKDSSSGSDEASSSEAASSSEKKSSKKKPAKKAAKKTATKKKKK